MIYRNYSIEPAFTERRTYIGQVNGRLIEAGSISDFEALFHSAVDEMLGVPERRKKSLWWIPLALLALLVIVLTLTKPSHDKHLKVLARTAAEMVDDRGANYGFDLSWLTGRISTEIIKELLGGVVYFQDYVVCNVSYVEMAGERQVLSVGVLGMVFTVSEERLAQYVNELLASLENSASGYLDGFLDSASEFFDGLLDSAGNLLDSAGTAISNFFDGLF